MLGLHYFWCWVIALAICWALTLSCSISLNSPAVKARASPAALSSDLSNGFGSQSNTQAPTLKAAKACQAPTACHVLMHFLLAEVNIPKDSVTRCYPYRQDCAPSGKGGEVSAHEACLSRLCSYWNSKAMHFYWNLVTFSRFSFFSIGKWDFLVCLRARWPPAPKTDSQCSRVHFSLWPAPDTPLQGYPSFSRSPIVHTTYKSSSSANFSWKPPWLSEP